MLGSRDFSKVSGDYFSLMPLSSTFDMSQAEGKTRVERESCQVYNI